MAESTRLQKVLFSEAPLPPPEPSCVVAIPQEYESAWAQVCGVGQEAGMVGSRLVGVSSSIIRKWWGMW